MDELPITSNCPIMTLAMTVDNYPDTLDCLFFVTSQSDSYSVRLAGTSPKIGVRR
jgi:hypothetical protein